MKRYFILSIVLLSISVTLKAQVVNKAANDAFLISRMSEKFHIEPKPVNKELSAAWFDNLIQHLDEDKLFFTLEDLLKLKSYREKLNEELLGKNTTFLQLLISIYRQRLKTADSIIDNVCRQPFRFTENATLTVTEITDYPRTTVEQRLKWFKLLKASALMQLIEFDEGLSLIQPVNRKKAIDSLEIQVRKKNNIRYKRFIKKITDGPGGIEQAVCTAYCQALATCFDPHSQFLPPSDKENFESALGNAPMQFGLQLNENKNGDIVVDNLKPGSPAFKSGQLNTGDIIQAVQWEGKEPIDLSGANEAEVSEILNANNQEKLQFTVKKVNGDKIQVSLAKERSEQAEDDNKVKSFLLTGGKKVGYISLPVFYTDWESNGSGMNGCSDDVAKELIKMKKEGIQGLILDLRYNGGGSMQEAVGLAGIFIDAGPVAQIKSREQKIITVMDVNRGAVYDGPLLILVNGYSASASEVVAGTLQDYNRALIVGSPTYGKATAQVILPLDTTIDLKQDFQNRDASSYLKLTIKKLYRINGSSAQATGVQPDIGLDDLLEAAPHREADAAFAFASSRVEPNKYYKPDAPLPLTALKAFAKSQTDTSAYFKAIRQYVEDYKHQQVKDISLMWTEAVAEIKKRKATIPYNPELNNPNATFSVSNPESEEQRLKKDPALSELYTIFKQRLIKDPYIRMAVSLLSFPAP